MKIRKLVAAALCVSVILAGCASYKPQMKSARDLDKCPYKQEFSGVSVGLDPYYTPAKTRGVFDNDFKDHELLAVNMMVFCPGGKTYRLKKSDIVLKDDSGKEFKPVDYKTAGDMVGRGYGYTVLWFFIGGIVGLIPSAIHTASVNTDIENDLKAAELPDNLEMTAPTKGFVYFSMEPYGKEGAPSHMTAQLQMEDLDTHEVLNYSIGFDPNAGW